MPRPLFALPLLFFSILAPVGAQAPAASSPASEEYRKLTAEQQKAQQEFFQTYNAAKTEEERNKLTYPDPQAFGKKFIELARKHPKDPVALDALLWVTSHASHTPLMDEAAQIVTTAHIDSPKLDRFCQALIYSGVDKRETYLTTILEKTPHEAIKGWATYSLARVSKEKAGESEAERKRAEELFESVSSKYGNISANRGTLGDLAKTDLFEMRHLSIGKVAPEIEGEDVDGKSFKLSDYRGKVVVLDFWGDW